MIKRNRREEIKMVIATGNGWKAIYAKSSKQGMTVSCLESVETEAWKWTSESCDFGADSAVIFNDLLLLFTSNRLMGVKPLNTERVMVPALSVLAAAFGWPLHSVAAATGEVIPFPKVVYKEAA